MTFFFIRLWWQKKDDFSSNAKHNFPKSKVISKNKNDKPLEN